MNYKLMLRMMGRTFQVEALCMLLPLVVCFIYGENPDPFLFTLVPVALAGTFLSFIKSQATFFSREGYVIVALIWLTMCVIGAIPFHLSGYFPSFVDCLFEITAGFSTTGATILADIEALPRGLLFWRSFSSWIGGMGVLLFTLAFLPKVGVRNHVLVQAELTGPIATKLVPKTVQSSQILYMIYISLTFLEMTALWLAGMPFYDAIVTSFATVCTGGFAVTNASMAAYGVPCQIVVLVFMFLSSLNFALFFLMATGRGKQALRSDELKFFLMAIGVGSLLVLGTILPLYDSVGRAILDSLFQVVAILSTTGFCTTDYNLWPPFAQTLLVILMFFGGCSGSTTGSMKCGRIMLLLRCAQRSLLRLSHPRAVKVVKLDGKAVDEATLNSVFSFFLLFVLLLGGGCLVLSLDGVSLATAFTASLGAISNVGPGLEAVGPVCNYAFLSDGSKLFLCLSMLTGRLEIFPILILFHPATWEKR